MNGYKPFQPHQYENFKVLDERAKAVELRAVLSDEEYGVLAIQAGRISLGDDFLRREALVYLELPEGHLARRFKLLDFIEERMLDQMTGEYPRSTM